MFPSRRGFLVSALLLALPLSAEARPPRRPASPPPAPPPPVIPELVAQDVSEMSSMLRRMRIYMVHAGRGGRAFGDLGDGEQLWFVLPSCRPHDPEDERRDACPIDRLEVSAVEGAPVRAGRMTTVMHGEVPRRVQAFVIPDGVRMVRVRLITPAGATRFDGVMRVSQLGDLPVPMGAPRGDTFDLDFSAYPGR